MAACNLLKVSSLAIKRVVKPNCIRSVHNLAPAQFVQTLINLPQTNVTTLDNGFKVASETSDTSACTVGVWADAGSRYETEEENGVANFFEHMAFKGTTQRAQKDLEKEVDAIGAQINAYTTREETAFYASCHSRDVSKAVELLSDIIRNSRLDEAQLEQERKVILSELDAAESDLNQVVMDNLHLIAYQKTPLSKTIFGPSSNIKKITRDDIVLYARNNFLAPRMVLACSGGVNHDELVKLAEKHFGTVPLTYTSEIPDLNPCRFTGSEIRVREDWFPFAHVAIAVDTCGHDSQDIYPLALAKTIIGRWDKTLGSAANTCNNLIRNIHKEPGCQSFEAFHVVYRDTGLWGINFVVDRMSIDDFVLNVQNEWMKLCTSTTETELRVAKNMLKANILVGLDGTAASCADIGRNVLNHGKRILLADVNEKIEAISLKHFKDVCLNYIYDRCPAVSSVGPVEQVPDYTRVRAGMYWLRI